MDVESEREIETHRQLSQLEGIETKKRCQLSLVEKNFFLTSYVKKMKAASGQP